MPNVPRVPPTLDVERHWLAAGKSPIAGVDEVGVGAIAGPLVAAAVALPLTGDLEALRTRLDEVRDSNHTRRYKHERLTNLINEIAGPNVVVGIVDVSEIVEIDDQNRAAEFGARTRCGGLARTTRIGAARRRSRSRARHLRGSSGTESRGWHSESHHRCSVHRGCPRTPEDHAGVRRDVSRLGVRTPFGLPQSPTSSRSRRARDDPDPSSQPSPRASGPKRGVLLAAQPVSIAIEVELVVAHHLHGGTDIVGTVARAAGAVIVTDSRSQTLALIGGVTARSERRGDGDWRRSRRRCRRRLAERFWWLSRLL